MPPKRRSNSTRSSTKPEWQRTWLWTTLEKRSREPKNDHASQFLATLQHWMTSMHTVLRSGGTAPLDFTLHDDSHALRVAQRMEDLLTPTTKRNLSDYELALLLLAAYGHDIGMTPERGKVQAHHRFLFGHVTNLSAQEQQDFQQFIDDFAPRPVTLPLSTSLEDLNLADEITAFYVRHRHNDWSADWMRIHLQGAPLGHLPDAVNVLIRLCGSHHEDFARLAQDSFSPFLTTGPSPQLVHLRYLACILRLADILENDPGRTPEVLYRHRSISERKKSLVHWQKDHALSIDLQGDQLVFEACPQSARAHRALLQLADWIDHELHGIAAFGERLPASFRVGSDTVHREWTLAPALRRRVRSAEGTYTYIDGAFRPNASRLLQLLANEQLYGRPIVAVRELLQNAFDAVREKVARQRLQDHITDPASPQHEVSFGQLEKVTLTLRRDGDGHYWLSCQDTGVGMTQALIRDHLLVSGQSRRHAILDLERRCAEKGFALGRTGQFGIGVLSYFMLAEEVHVTTTRWQGCGDLDGTGWHFITQGLGDFGELRPLTTPALPQGGTRMDWRLRPDCIPDPEAFAEELQRYLKETLIRIPCQFEFKTQGLTSPAYHWQRPTGWVKTQEDWLHRLKTKWKEPEEMLAGFDPYPDEDEQRMKAVLQRYYAAEWVKSRAAIRCAFLELALPDGVGHVRLVLPYFDLPQGRSLRFPWRDGETAYPGGGDRPWAFPFESKEFTAWRGMVCRVKQTGLHDDANDLWWQRDSQIQWLPAVFSADLDIITAKGSHLKVSRDSLELPDDITEQWETQLWATAERFADEVLSTGAGSYYSELNAEALGNPITLHEGAAWTHNDSGNHIRPLRRPFTTFGGYKLSTFTGTAVGVITSSSELPAPSHLMAVQLSADRQCPAFVWSHPQASSPPAAVQLPPGWRDIAVIHHGSDNEWRNPEHPVIRCMAPGITHFSGSSAYNLQTVLDGLEKAETASQAATFLFAAAQPAFHFLDDSPWRIYRHNRADHLRQLWQLIATESGQPLSSLRIIATDLRKVVLLSPNDYVICHSGQNISDILPQVMDPDFLLLAQGKVGEPSFE